MSNKRNIYTLLILLPIIEIINNVLSLIIKNPINISSITISIFTFVMFIYLILKSSYKHKNKFIILILLISLLAFISSNSLLKTLKILQLPILLICLITYFNDRKIDKNELIRILNYSTLFYTLLLIFLLLVKKETFNISIILVILLPFIFKTLRDGKYKRTIIITMVIISILLTGNLLSIIGVLLDLTILLIFSLLKKDKNKKNIIVITTLLLTSIMFIICTTIKINCLDINKINLTNNLLIFIVYIIPILLMVYNILKNKLINTNVIFYIIMLIFIYIIYYTNNNINYLYNTYFIIYLLLAYAEIGLIIKREHKLEKNKITIYALHLNYGGIEKSICTKANILSENYIVEIISLYKINNKPAFELKNNVKVNYLLERLKPNKEEFKNALKSLNIINIIKEGCKALKILYLKDILITKSIINCNSEKIISTRLDFSEKLVKYNEYNNIKIAEEHIYHNNNKKYLKRIKILLNKIDYLMPSSNYLTTFYKDLYIKNRYKIHTNKMPIETDGKKSNLKNKNIIAVGRLSKEKGFRDLINLFSKTDYKDWTLNIVGEGPEYSNLNELINTLNLNNNVKLLGRKNTSELNELYKNSSIYIMTSYEESFGLVLVEASSHGLPIIAYSSALGAVEILNNSNGILIDNRNENEMINNLNNLMNNIDLLKEYQKKSLEIYKEYKYESLKNEIINFYKKTRKNIIYTSLYKDSKEKSFRVLEKKLENKEKTFIITANAETYMLTEIDPEINDMINNPTNMIVPDGIGVVKTARYLGLDIKERIPGIDIAEHLLKVANEKKYKVYLFGASVEVIEKLSQEIEKKYPCLKLVGASNGYIKDKDTVMEYIKTTKPDIVMIALGIPNQEKLINKHIKDFDKGIFIGVGGSFDVLSGMKKRAPEIFIKLNLEWLYRIILEPKRIKRFLKYNVKLITKIAKEKKIKIKKTKKK